MDSSVSPKDEIWFLRVCHHISNAVYHLLLEWSTYTNGTTWILLLQQNCIRDREGNMILAQTQYSEFENWGRFCMTDEQYNGMKLIYVPFCLAMIDFTKFRGLVGFWSWQLGEETILTVRLLLYERNGNVLRNIAGNRRDCKSFPNGAVRSH